MSYHVMDKINYDNYAHLRDTDCTMLMNSLANDIYTAYILDWSRHILVTGKGLKEIHKKKCLSMENFPVCSDSINLWLERNFGPTERNVKIKRGWESEGGTMQMKEGLKSVGKM